MRLLNPLRVIAAITLFLAWLPSASAQGIARAAAQPLAATLNQTIYTPLFEGQSVTAFYVSGLTASGATLTVEGSNDGKAPTDATKTWFAANSTPTTCPATPFTTLTTDQSFRVDTAAMTDIRVRVSTGGTGTILVSFNAIPGATLTTASCGSSSPSGGGSTSSNLSKGAVSVTPTVTAGAYTANQALGGLETVALYRTTTQPSGLLNYVGFASKGGITANETVYAFTKLPVSTCTDHAAFVLSNTDLPFLIPGFPISMTPVISAGTTQTTASSNPNVATSNADTTPTQNLYFCWVTGVTTPASVSDVVNTYTVLQD